MVEELALLTEHQGDIIFGMIKPILKDYDLMKDETQWTFLYDEDRYEYVIGFCVWPEGKGEPTRQVDVWQIDEDLEFHYWIENHHLCQFKTTLEGTLIEFIK